MQKEKEIKDKIKQIVIDGGVVTIDCDDYRYTPAPMRTLEECNKIINLDKEIKIDFLIELLREDSELKVVMIHENIILVVEKGTEVGVYCY